MKDGAEIIEMTPLIFEDGNTYYFKVVKRGSSNDWHNLFVYRKVIIDEKYGFFKLSTRKVDFMQVINENPELIDTKMDVEEVKRSIKKIILSNKANAMIKGWDGFVGNVSDESKKALLRDSKLKDILG